MARTKAKFAKTTEEFHKVQQSNAKARSEKMIYKELGPGAVAMISSDRQELGQRIRQCASNAHAAPRILSALKLDSTFEGGFVRVEGQACPSCGDTVTTANGTPVIKEQPGNYPAQPRSYSCDSCDHYLGGIDALVDLHIEQWRKKLSLYRGIQGSDPVVGFSTVASYKGGPPKAERWTENALRAVLPSQHDRQVRLLKAQAVDESQIAELLLLPELSELMVEVELDKAGRPIKQWTEHGWSLEDQSLLHKAEADRRAEVELLIDADLQALRRQRLQEAGL
jgi:hypothetical protein